jgi:hypothetical protein
MAGPTKCEVRWTEFRASFEKEHDSLLTAYPDAQEEIALIRMALNTIMELVRNSPSINGEGPVWEQLADKAEADRKVLCSYLDGKALLTGVLRVYATLHKEMNVTIQKGEPDPKGEFREQRRRKWIPSAEKAQAKRSSITRDPKVLPHVAVSRDTGIPS